MTRQGLIAVVVVVILIMFAPILFADGVEKFFTGLGTMLDRWTK